MNPDLFAATIFFTEPELQTDFAILVRLGRLQEHAQRQNDDTPGGFFARAAFTYLPNDSLGRIARRACRHIAREFREGVPS